MKIASVILAAGQGTRMVSNLPKVLHPLNGKEIVLYAIEAARGAGSEKPVLVIGNGADEVQRLVGDQARFAVQNEQLGTAHAVMSAEDLVKGKADLVLVTYGDMPLLTAQTLSDLVAAQKANPGPMTMLTVLSSNPRGFGRVVRAADGSVKAIVEEAWATPEQLKINELNVGAYCFSAAWLWDALKQIKISPKGEYYLTDIVAVAVEAGKPVAAITLEDELEAMGINTRVHLAEAEAAIRRRINERWMLAGVTMLDPNLVYIEDSVTLGMDTVLLPNTYLRGHTSIGEGCRIGPNTLVTDSKVGNDCTLLASFIEGAILEDRVTMGPFCRLRRGAHLREGVHMGNFGEVKDSTLGPGTKMGHFSYIGNADIGENVNIGAGTITCNFDGVKKHPTVIGDDVFIGSDTMLVAPVTIGKGAHTGAGAVVTRDVPAGDTVVGVPAHSIRRKKEH
jgi:bifunctional UDP-N-acetylglucosamine pyrophosphorylase/glucosamine-1-phosphate N-acetyltransferase